MKRHQKLSRLELISELKEKHLLFPNYTTHGSYEYFSQTISLPRTNQEQLERATSRSDLADTLKVMPLLMHETTHFADHLTTLWGVDFLATQFDAIHARLGENESEYWRIVNLHRAERRHHFAEYHTHIYEAGYEEPDGQKWIWQLSTGVAFDRDGKPDESKPIVFTRFRNQSNQDVCRVPFSIASLLEVNAMSMELATKFAVLSSMDEGERRVEEKIFEKKSLANLYDPFLAVYNVAVHLLANKMGLTNTFQAFVSASVLSGFCLNFPKQLFQKIDIPDLFRSDRTTHGRARRLADQCDRGFLYVVLLEYAKPSELDDPEAWLEATLKQAGLPDISTTRKLAKHELEQLVATHEDGPATSRFLQLIEFGKKHLEEHGLRLNRHYDGLDQLIPPFFVENDQKLILNQVSEGQPLFASLDDWLRDSFRYSNLIREFTNACTL